MRSSGASVTCSMTITFVPSVCWIVTVFVTDALLLPTLSCFTLRVVLDAGAATTSVVVAVPMRVLVRPAVTVVPLRSTQEA
jgi:hypothetical protein